jgi:antitoxin (DNA-binding transcriptional repressor) of toxin-antitoxin stability system
MKVVETVNATGTLAEYAAEIANGPIIITTEGTPVAALVPIENVDLETVSLGNSCSFLEIIERSHTKFRTEGGISSEEMRRRFE